MMAAQLAKIYVVVLLVAELLLLGACLLLHISVWIGVGQLSARSAQAVLVGTLIVCFVTFFLAEERNVWKNEFKSCPMWMRVLALTFLIYGTVTGFSEIVLSSIRHDPGNLLAISAMIMALNSISLCILYSILWARPLHKSELVKRSRMSFIAAIVGLVILLANHAGYLSHQVR